MVQDKGGRKRKRERESPFALSRSAKPLQMVNAPILWTRLSGCDLRTLNNIELCAIRREHVSIRTVPLLDPDRLAIFEILFTRHYSRM